LAQYFIVIIKTSSFALKWLRVLFYPIIIIKKQKIQGIFFIFLKICNNLKHISMYKRFPGHPPSQAVRMGAGK